MKVSQVVTALEKLAPPHLAADWDNVGLLLGDNEQAVRKVLFCIDMTPAVVAEAIAAKAQMVMAYHPAIFKNVTRITEQATPALFRAARAGLAVYSVHTAFDAAPGGTNDSLADALGLQDRRPLEPLSRRGECKIVVFVPPGDLSQVAEAAFTAGAGRIGNYFDCEFFGHGVGSFCGSADSHPTIGSAGKHEATEELRLEVVAPRSAVAQVCAAIRNAHSYETPVVDVYPLEDYPDGCGMGRVGRLKRPRTLAAIITQLKRATGAAKVLVAQTAGKNHAKDTLVSVAACGAGSCGDLYRKAIACGADLYITGEMRHHDALAAAHAGLTVVCLGHSHSERLALKNLAGNLRQAIPTLATVQSRADRDPFDVV